MDLAGKKKRLRERVGALRDALSAREHADASGAICERLWHLCGSMAHAGPGPERLLRAVAALGTADVAPPVPPSQAGSSTEAMLSVAESAPPLARGSKLNSTADFPHSFALAAYMPHRSEADIAPLIERCWRAGAPVALPKAEPRERRLRFYYARGAADLAVGAYGIREPLPTLPEATAAELAALDVLLVPGLAFDESLRRLGYGGGYYDRLLAALALQTDAPFGGAADERRDTLAAHASRSKSAPTPRRPLLIAAAFELQLVDAVPTEPHDIPLDAVVTERRVILPRKVPDSTSKQDFTLWG
jgi:5-formyltetrahydrofolate cyclo-ligase